VILHADMDAFYASVEQRDDPSLRGKPVIVGGTGGRGVVSAASYEARRFGVRSAMPSAQARALCPHGVFLPGDMAKYAAESRRIFAIFGRFSPLVERLSLDEAFLDLAGCEQALGPPEQIARDLRAAVRRETDLAVSCGIAPIKMAAKIASDLAKPDGVLLVPADGVRAFLAPLPVGRIWGVGPVAEERLLALGIRAIGDLAARSPEALRSALGDWGLRLAALARGEDARGVDPAREAKSYGEENTFERDVRDPEALRSAIRAHAEAIARRLRRDGVCAGGVVLKWKPARPADERGRFAVHTRSQRLPSATDDGLVLGSAACRLLERAALAEPVRLIGVSAQRIEPAASRQLELFAGGPRDPRAAKLNAALDEIQQRFGGAALYRGARGVERASPTHSVKSGTD
jgi:DNA polymerase IV